MLKPSNTINTTNKTAEDYKKEFLDIFGLELDLEKCKEYGKRLAPFIKGAPRNAIISFALRSSHEFGVIDTLKCGNTLPKNKVEKFSQCIFVHNIWTIAPSEVISFIKGEGTIMQKARRLSGYFEKPENIYALATILGLDTDTVNTTIDSINSKKEEVLSR